MLFFLPKKLNMSTTSSSNTKHYSSSNSDEEHAMMVATVHLYRQMRMRKTNWMYTYALTGHDRMLEFIHGYEDRIYNRTWMPKDFFIRLVRLLEEQGRLQATRWISVEDQLLKFLYVVAHCATNRQSREDWQHSGSTLHNNQVLYHCLQPYVWVIGAVYSASEFWRCYTKDPI